MLYIEPHRLQKLSNAPGSLLSPAKSCVKMPQRTSDETIRPRFSNQCTAHQQPAFNIASASDDSHSTGTASSSYPSSSNHTHNAPAAKDDPLENQLRGAEHAIFQAPKSSLGLARIKEISPRQLPRFIKPFSNQIGPDELELLKIKGVMEVPSGFLLYEILQCFIHFAYWDSPAISLTTFVKTVSSEAGKNGRVSLLLFHAVMFVGLTYLPQETFACTGYKDRRAMEDQFFSKARLLYDLGSERDTLDTIQALLLLVQGLSRSEGLKDRWHWLGIAISLSYTIGLHRMQPEQRSDSHDIRTKRRTWWCCVYLDRLLALTEGRPTRIRLEESSTTPLSIEHFDFDSALDGSSRRLALENMNNFLQRIELMLQMNGSLAKNLSAPRIAASRRAVGTHNGSSVTSVPKSNVAADFEARVFGHLLKAGYLRRNT